MLLSWGLRVLVHFRKDPGKQIGPLWFSVTFCLLHHPFWVSFSCPGHSQIVQLSPVAPTTFSFVAKSWSKLLLFNKHWLILSSLLLLDAGPKNHCLSLTSTAELCPRISSRQQLGCCVARCTRCSRVLFCCPPRLSLYVVLPLALWWVGKKRPQARYIFLGLMFQCHERELRTES